MRFEKSAGFVVFWPKPLEYLILHYEEGHWDFPKGHIEPGETPLDAAKRELLEETGITAEHIEGFEHTYSYFFRARYLNNELVKKEVHFFLGRALSRDVRLSEEHIGFGWFDFESAVERLTYDNAKELLRKAHSFISRLTF